MVDNAQSARLIGVALEHLQATIRADQQGELRIVATAGRSGYVEDSLRIQEERVHY